MLTSMTMVFVIAILGVISPGPDFAMVTHRSLHFGKRAGLLCAGGLALGIVVHTIYCVLALDLLKNQPLILSGIRLAGGCYLIYLGVQVLRATLQKNHEKPTSVVVTSVGVSDGHWIRQGFFTNLLNPKAVVFMASLYSQAVTPELVGNRFIFIFGLEVALVVWAWFSVVAMAFSHAAFRARIGPIQNKFEAVLGLALIIFGVSIFR